MLDELLVLRLNAGFSYGSLFQTICHTLLMFVQGIFQSVKELPSDAVGRAIKGQLMCVLSLSIFDKSYSRQPEKHQCMLFLYYCNKHR